MKNYAIMLVGTALASMLGTFSADAMAESKPGVLSLNLSDESRPAIAKWGYNDTLECEEIGTGITECVECHESTSVLMSFCRTIVNEHDWYDVD